MNPRRLQRSRRSGARVPKDAVYVGRPTIYGNPHRVEGIAPRGTPVGVEHRAEAVRRFAADLISGKLPVSVADVKRELAGRDLVCWCPLPKDGEPDHCHASVLLRIANAKDGE